MLTTRNTASLTSLSLLALTLSMGSTGCAVAPLPSAYHVGHPGLLTDDEGSDEAYDDAGYAEESDQGYGADVVYVDDAAAISASVSIGGAVGTHVGLATSPAMVISPVVPVVPVFPRVYTPGYSTGGTRIAGDDIGDHYGDEIEINQKVTNVNKVKNVHNRSRTKIDNSTKIRRGPAQQAGRKSSARKSRVTAKSTQRSTARVSSKQTRRPAAAKSRNTRKAGTNKSRATGQTQPARKQNRTKPSHKNSGKHN